jgi:lysozyme family protein
MDEKQKFKFAIKVVLQHEGGLSENEHDAGGATNWGVSQRFADAEKLNIDVKNLTQAEAIAIYKKCFWDKYNYNALKGQYIATKVFDISVNCGPKQAAKMLQIACNDLGLDKVGVDGILGPKTIALANKVDQYDLLNELREVQKQFYLNLVKNKPENKVFLTGWLFRAAW